MSGDKTLVEERLTQTLELMKAMAKRSITDYLADGTAKIARAEAKAHGFSLESYYAYEKGQEEAFKTVIKWLEMDLAGRRCNVYGEPLD